jgi:uncharacterized protein YycO
VKRKRTRVGILLLIAVILFFLIKPVHLFKHKINCEPIGAVTYEDRLLLENAETGWELPPLEDGDILLTFSTHTLGWHHGHAGLVIDAEKEKVLEAAILGSDSQVLNIRHWRNYADVTVLRLKDTDMETRQKIADFADENLRHTPYKLTSGLFGEKAPEPSEEIGVQCAYLIWYAYQHFGVDLDADGGRLVTVKDIEQSPKLKVVDHFEVD